MVETALPLAAKAARHLAERGIENARLDAEWMLASLLGLSRLDLYLQFDRPVDAEQLSRYRDYVRRRLRREPIQYILGRAAFRTLELQVDPRVLIPRPETEILVEQVLVWLRRSGKGGEGVETAVVLEIGTGSGAIALSLAREARARVVATDISAAALAVAGENARRLALETGVEFRHGDLWQAVRTGERFDVIVTNPPYVAEADADTLQPEVREWEPKLALFGGGDGLRLIEAIVQGAPDRLRPGGLLALEVGAQQARAVSELLAQSGQFTHIRVQSDLTGHDRVVLAESSTG